MVEDVFVTQPVEPEVLRLGRVMLGAAGEADPLGGDELPELSQERAVEHVLVAEAVRLGDEAKDPLLVTTSECRHVQKIRRSAYGLQVPTERPSR